MEVGMMWQEKESVPVIDRVKHAVAYYQKKYGRCPDAAFVNPKLLTDRELIVDGVAVYSMRLPISQLWIGVEETAKSVEQASEELLTQMEMAL